MSTQTDPEWALAELWRRELYPHIDPKTFQRFLADTAAEGWDDTRKEVAAVVRIVTAGRTYVDQVTPEEARADGTTAAAEDGVSQS